MNSVKKSKRALKSLISDSFKEALSTLDLPQPTKKIKKLIDKNAKKLSSVYSEILKREEKKKKKAEKIMVKALSNSNGKRKPKARTEEKLIEPVKL
jgi:CRISPR/Cas system CSM-associated protein Csm2 small subunit